MHMYNLREYSDNHSKTSGTLFQYFRDVPAADNNGAVTDFTEANVNDLFNLKVKLAGQAGNDGTKNVETMVLFKYLSNFWRTLEMPLTNCEIILDLSWSGNCVIVATNIVNKVATFSVTDTNLYAPVVTLSIKNNAELFEQLKSGLKRTIN